MQSNTTNSIDLGYANIKCTNKPETDKKAKHVHIILAIGHHVPLSRYENTLIDHTPLRVKWDTEEKNNDGYMRNDINLVLAGEYFSEGTS